jgi:hypothetical protein
MEGDLRLVRAGLDADVSAGARRVELVAGQRRQRAQRRAGRCAASPKRSEPPRSKSVGPNPNVSVRLAAGRSSASPVSVGGATGAGLPSLSRRPAVSVAAAAVQPRSSSRRAARDVPSMTSNAAMCRRDCVGVTIPAWCSP